MAEKDWMVEKGACEMDEKYFVVFVPMIWGMNRLSTVFKMWCFVWASAVSQQ